MQAVILAAGRGTRMGDLTDTVPKPLLLVAGKSLLVHKLAALPSEVDEVIFVIGYQGQMIRDAFGAEYEGRKIRYVEQKELNGTMGAVLLAQPLITGRFMVMMGDDLYGREDIETCIRNPDWSLLVEKTESMASGGRVVATDEGFVTGIEEGDHRGTPGLMNTNLIVLDKRVFDFPMVPIRTANGKNEYGLPQTVVASAKEAAIPLHAVYATSWIQITAPEDLGRAATLLGVE